MCIYIYVCVHIYIYIYIYVCMYACMCECINIYLYTIAYKAYLTAIISWDGRVDPSHAKPSQVHN